MKSWRERLTLPAVVATGTAASPTSAAWTFPIMIFAAFVVSWGAEAAEFLISQGLALAILALIQTLPEFAVEAVIAWKAGKDPEMVHLAIANFTGSLRLLTGLGWPMIYAVAAFYSRKRRGKPLGKIQLHDDHAVEVLGERVFVDPSAVLIGDIEIGEDSSVWPLTVIRGDMHRIRIGQRTSIQDGSVLHITHAGPFNPDGFPLTIGDEVTVGHKVTLHGCTLGNRILVGMGSILMDGAVVEDDVIIGAGSLVPPGKTLESGFLYVGSPVKQARPLTDKERSFFSYTAGNYVKLKDQHRAEA